ncbi:MAG: fatty acid desaturase [Gemmatimonadetes bacterium]|nr:fatty acid desaturase [Gemmatimonadota bacterium]
MSGETTDFRHSTIAEPHRARTKDILKTHPEVRQLIGTDSSTFWFTLGLVTFQFVLAALIADKPWWAIALLAWCVGAFANHSLFVMIHEATHKLVFKQRIGNIITGLLANLPLAFPSYASFQKYHLKHHAFQGVYELDADVPSEWEARLIGHSAFGKATWLLLYAFFQMARPFRLKEIQLFDGLTAVNWLVQMVVNVAVWFVFGPGAVVYFTLSLLFSIGLHPLGARWIQRHYLTGEDEQETFSYYGALNKIAFNVGYHNEHHDLPSVPWSKLPEINAIAPELYVPLKSHQSWGRLLLQFLFDPKLSLWSRVVRRERNNVAMTEEYTPDVEMIRAGR